MSSHTHEHPATATHTVKDPVCGMDVDPNASEHTAMHDGSTYFFCSAHCKATFEANPHEYTGMADASHAGLDHIAAASSVPEGEVAEWTCPMHPEIRQAGSRVVPHLRDGAGAGDGDR